MPAATAKARLSRWRTRFRLLRFFSGDENGSASPRSPDGCAWRRARAPLANTLTAARFLGRTPRPEVPARSGALRARRAGAPAHGRGERGAPEARELLEKTGETVQLGIVDHLSVLYVYEWRAGGRFHGRGGRRTRAACTARPSARCLLAAQPAGLCPQVIGARPDGLHAEDAMDAKRRRGVAGPMSSASYGAVLAPNYATTTRRASLPHRAVAPSPGARSPRCGPCRVRVQAHEQRGDIGPSAVVDALIEAGRRRIGLRRRPAARGSPAARQAPRSWWRGKEADARRWGASHLTRARSRPRATAGGPRRDHITRAPSPIGHGADTSARLQRGLGIGLGRTQVSL